MTLLEARTQYFADNEFGDDGGYNDAFVTVYLFGLPVKFPNTAGRKKAVVFHDMHHLVTGYKTDNLGESEISAYELGTGCASVPVALVLNTLGLLLGVAHGPARVFRAFVRGRQSANLYGRDADELLGRDVAEVRAELGLDQSVGKATPSDVVLFAMYFCAAVMAALLPIAALGLGAYWLWWA